MAAPPEPAAARPAGTHRPPAPPGGAPGKRTGWGWRSNLVAGLIVAAVGALIMTGQMTRYGRPLPSAYGIPFVALGILIAAGVLDRLRRRRA